jgi:hypothetical protein
MAEEVYEDSIEFRVKDGVFHVPIRAVLPYADVAVRATTPDSLGVFPPGQQRVSAGKNHVHAYSDAHCNQRLTHSEESASNRRSSNPKRCLVELASGWPSRLAVVRTSSAGRCSSFSARDAVCSAQPLPWVSHGAKRLQRRVFVLTLVSVTCSRVVAGIFRIPFRRRA